MSPIAKIIIAASVAAMAAPAVIAQERPAFDFEAMMGDGPAASGETANDSLSSAIDDAISRLLSEASAGASPNAKDITIEEIDTLNREAKRAEASRALESARLGAIKARLDVLLSLREVMKSSATAAADVAPTQDLSGPTPEQIEVQRSQANTKNERALLPIVESISGASGRLKAQIIMGDGANIEASPGMTIPMGYRVESITASSVTLRGPITGDLYMIAPGGGRFEAKRAPEDGPPTPAVDLGGFPMGVF